MKKRISRNTLRRMYRRVTVLVLLAFVLGVFTGFGISKLIGSKAADSKVTDSISVNSSDKESVQTVRESESSNLEEKEKEETKENEMESTPSAEEQSEAAEDRKDTKDREEIKDGEPAEDREETKDEESAEDREETKDGESAGDREETKDGESAEDREDTKYDEVAEDREDTKDGENAKDNEHTRDSKHTRVQAVMEVKEETEDDEQAVQILSHLKLEEKVAQMFIVTPDAFTGVDGVTQAGDGTREVFEQYPVGGFIYMDNNLQDPEQVKAMLANMQEISYDRLQLPAFLSVDEEGKSVSRVASNENFGLEALPSMKNIGETGDVKKAYEIGQTIGSYLSDLGFNMNYAPDADVLTNANNTVIGSRSFGSDPELVSSMVQAEVKGLREKEVIPVIKHFPGHGATSDDTHEGYAYTETTLDEMMKSELLPFADAVNDGIEVIMAAHISCPSITKDKTPASLSKVMIHDILRTKLNYDGLVITDALNMGAIVDKYRSAEAAVMAVDAGADILLMPADFKRAYEGILDAVEDGTLTEERIDESVLRILKLKAAVMETKNMD